VDIVTSQQVKDVDIIENSCVVQILLNEPNPMVEKSLRYQIEAALKAQNADLQVAVNFSTNDGQGNRLNVGSIIAVGSGKGGVGKSSVAINLAIAFQKLGYRVGVIDCDIYGPSIPTMLGIEDKKPMMMNGKIQPVEAFGLKVISAGFFVEQGQSLIWRGPMIHKLIHQFAYDVDWKECDVLVVDLPPGTGDAPLSLSQTLPLTGAVMVSLPQKVSIIDVHKSLSMFHQVKVPVLGMVENMSHYECSSCHHREEIFDHGRVRKFCSEQNIPYLGEIPIDPRLRQGCDEGRPFLLDYENSAAGQALLNTARRLQPFLKTVEESAEDAIRIVS